MKKEEKNHVGRPTNEELKQRRNKKIMKIALPIGLAIIIIIVGILVFQKNYFNKIKGATKSYGPNSALYVSALNSKVRRKGCSIVIPLKLSNTSDSLTDKTVINIYKVKLKYPGTGNKDIKSGSVDWKIPIGKTIERKPQFSLKNIDATTKKLEIIVYWKDKRGVAYYTPETIKLANKWYNIITECKKTTVKSVTTKKSGTTSSTKKTTVKSVTTKKSGTTSSTKKTSSGSSSNNKTTTKKTTTTSKVKLSKLPETYSVVKEGQEPNKCAIKLLDLQETKAEDNQTVKSTNIKYQVVCQANARPMTVRINNNGKETIILKDFSMHKGYFAIHTYTYEGALNKSSKLKLYYKQQYSYKEGSSNQKAVATNIYKNDTANILKETQTTLEKNVPSENCKLTVSNVSANSFKWNVKCDSGAKPKSVRLLTTYKGKPGSQVAILRKGYSGNYGINETKVVNKGIKSNTSYTAVLYYGTKEYGYYKTSVNFKTPSK